MNLSETPETVSYVLSNYGVLSVSGASSILLKAKPSAFTKIAKTPRLLYSIFELLICL